MLAAVGLGDRLDAYPHEMSVGMRKRLEVARALLADDSYFLADEPFGTVDAVTRLSMWRLWRDLRRTEPRTGLLCTHDPEEALRLCDSVIALRSDGIASEVEVVAVPVALRGLGLEDESVDLARLKRHVTAMISGADDA